MFSRTFVYTFALAAALTGVAVASQTPRTQAPKPSAVMTAMQGSWLMTSTNGQDMAGSGMEVVVTITDDKYVQTMNGQVEERGSFKIDETKKPMTLDVTITEGEKAGMTELGVIEVDGKTMRGKLAEPGATARPTDFAAAEGFFTFSATKK